HVCVVPVAGHVAQRRAGSGCPPPGVHSIRPLAPRSALRVLPSACCARPQRVCGVQPAAAAAASVAGSTRTPIVVARPAGRCWPGPGLGEVRPESSSLRSLYHSTAGGYIWPLQHAWLVPLRQVATLHGT